MVPSSYSLSKLAPEFVFSCILFRLPHINNSFQMINVILFNFNIFFDLLLISKIDIDIFIFVFILYKNDLIYLINK